MESWKSKNIKFKGPVFSVVSGKAEAADGQIVQRDVVNHVGSVAIVPFVDNSILFAKQFRISIGREIIEIPAGRIEAAEKPELSATRELQEELGYKTDNLVKGCSYFSSVGFLDEKVHIYFAFNLIKSVTKREPDECIEVIKMPLDLVKEKLKRNQFEDSKTIIGLHELFDYLSNSKINDQGLR